MRLPSSLQNLINEFSRLPGIGPKTSQRLVFSLLHWSEDRLQGLINALSVFNKEICLCPQCFNFSDNGSQSLCTICSDSKRDHSIICVVADNLDLIAIEQTNYQGLYHILGGTVNPLHGIKLEDLRVKELLARLNGVNIRTKEIILAFDPNQEGELTYRALRGVLSAFPLKITRLGCGLPQGGDLDYADEITLSEALRGRREL